MYLSDEAKVLLKNGKVEDLKQLSLDKLINPFSHDQPSLPLNTQEPIYPSFCIDPITMDILENPVLAPSGRIYSKNIILQIIDKGQTDPYTRQPLREESLIELNQLQLYIDSIKLSHKNKNQFLVKNLEQSLDNNHENQYFQNTNVFFQTTKALEDFRKQKMNLMEKGLFLDKSHSDLKLFTIEHLGTLNKMYCFRPSSVPGILEENFTLSYTDPKNKRVHCCRFEVNLSSDFQVLIKLVVDGSQNLGVFRDFQEVCNYFEELGYKKFDHEYRRGCKSISSELKL